MRSRIFNIMQYENHPETGEHLIDERQIQIALAHKSIKRWAYIRHDEDVYSDRDEADNPNHKAGQTKPPHFHIVCQCGSNVEVSVMARWFGIPENFIDCPKGQGAFLDCVQYLTHEGEKQQQLGKRLYDDDRVTVSDGFDFRAELQQRDERKLKYGKDLSPAEILRNEVLFHGMTLRDARDKYPLEYMNDVSTLERHRLRYITTIQPLPKSRLNFYIDGPGGMGKGLMSKALARTLCGDLKGEKYDEDIYFEVGADNASFEGYDGQPVIIWNDCRAFTLLKKLGGRENVFNVFDPFPGHQKQNVKYSSVCLKNHINIVNSVQSWQDFLNGLAGEYKTNSGEVREAEDKSQSYRRFPFFIVLHEADYDLGINKGMFRGTREYDQYLTYEKLRGSMKQIVERCGDNYVLRNVQSDRMLKPVKQKADELEAKLQHPQQGTDEEIEAEFADYGKWGGRMTSIDLGRKGD